MLCLVRVCGVQLGIGAVPGPHLWDAAAEGADTEVGKQMCTGLGHGVGRKQSSSLEVLESQTVSMRVRRIPAVGATHADTTCSWLRAAVQGLTALAAG